MRLVSPENAGKVLSADIYWTVPFLALYLERCDALAFEDPRQAHLLARHAPGLAALIGVGARPGEYTGDVQKRSFRVHALAVHAGICRRIGEVTEAVSQYRHAFDLLEAGQVDSKARAELFSRFGLLKLQAEDMESALSFFTRAIELHEGDPPGQAQVLVLRAGWYWTNGEPKNSGLDLAHALSEAAKCPADPRSSRAVICAFNNLTRLVAENQLPMDERSQVIRLVSAARKRLSRARTSPIKMKLLWAEAMMSRSLFFTPHALRLLLRAREGFRLLGVPIEFAIVSVETALLMREEGDFQALEELRRDTEESLLQMTQDVLFLEILKRWTLRESSEGLLEVKQALEEMAN